MSRIALKEADTPYAHALARQAVRNVAREVPPDGNAFALVEFLRRAIRYTREHPDTVAPLPWLMAFGAGDCDDVATALVSLLIPLGFPREQIRWAVGERPEIWHLWVKVYSPDAKRWLDLDASSVQLPNGQDPATVGRFTRVTAYPVEAPPMKSLFSMAQ